MSVVEGSPGDAAKWRFVRRRAFAAFQAHGYSEVRPPPIEPAGRAARTGGAAALAVEGGELRTDLMVSIASLFAETAGAPSSPAETRFARWMLTGNAFEREPVGALRTRAWQAVSGVLFGTGEPAADAELVSLCRTLEADIGLTAAEVVLGSNGDAADLERYRTALAEVESLRCPRCVGSPNLFAFLTCEDEGCRALTTAAPPIRESIGEGALEHHQAVLATLAAAGFAVKDDPRLAFGGGRYQRTVVELRARTGSGQLLTLARGGRRDPLVESLGGAPTPAIGLNFGVARAAACTPGEGDSYRSACEIFFAARGPAGHAFALKAAAGERSRGFRVDVDLRETSWEEQLRRAENVRARVVVVVGDSERKRGEVAIRDLRSRETRHISEDALPAELKRLLR